MRSGLVATALADTEITHSSTFDVTLTAGSVAATDLTAIDAATTKVVDGSAITTITGTDEARRRELGARLRKAEDDVRVLRGRAPHHITESLRRLRLRVRADLPRGAVKGVRPRPARATPNVAAWPVVFSRDVLPVGEEARCFVWRTAFRRL